MPLEAAARQTVDRTQRDFVWFFLAALVIAWLCLLFFQLGDPWDESEHAHAAWLISQGKHPIDDFFQHHQPLLWSLLAVYFRIGLHGAGVMIWGRVLVALSGAATALALVRLANPGGQWRCNAGVCLSIGLFIGLTILLPALFVCRPETIATGAFMLALALWAGESPDAENLPLGVLSGALAGASFYASPRFVLLGGFFALLGKQSPRRWLYLTAGGVLFVAIYTVAAGFSLNKVLFNIEFSAYLQSIGERPYGAPAGTWMMLTAVVCSPLAALLAAVRQNRLRGVIILAYTLSIFIVCHELAGFFRYPQAYAPFVAAAAIAANWIAARIHWTSEPAHLIAFTAAGALLVRGTATLTGGVWPLPAFNFIASVEARDRLAAMVPRGGTVLLFTNDSPITIADASYYANPLWDAQDRLCRAVRGFKPKLAALRIKLPPCEFFDVLQRGRPFLTEKEIGRAVTAAEVRKAERIIEARYRPVSMNAASPAFMRVDLVQLRDGMPAGYGKASRPLLTRSPTS